MKTQLIYLIRHAEPSYDTDGRATREGFGAGCLGGTDLPLSPFGKKQAEQLAAWLRDKNISELFTSPLIRSRQTAEAIAAGCGCQVSVREGLREMDTGIWDGLSFEEIKNRYPEEYRKRGEDLWNIPVPGGESFHAAGERFFAEMEHIVSEGPKDGSAVCVIAHAGVNRAFLKLACGLPEEVTKIPQPCGGINVIRVSRADSGTHRYASEQVGWRPDAFLDRETILELYRRLSVPDPVIGHMEAVAAFLDRMSVTSDLSAWNRTPDLQRLRKAALVHDLFRTEPGHAKKCEAFLKKEGWPEIAAIVGQHHGEDTGNTGEVTEADLLFYADKRVSGTKTVSLEERFAESMKKCTSEEARLAHAGQKKRAERVETVLRKMSICI